MRVKIDPNGCRIDCAGVVKINNDSVGARVVENICDCDVGVGDLND